MNDKLRIALEAFNKASKEYSKKNAEYKKAHEATREAWDAVDFAARKERSADWQTACDASNKENSLSVEADIAKITMWAAGMQAAKIAGQLIREDIIQNPEKYTAPVHYKKITDRLNNITGDEFSITTDDYRIKIRLKKGSYGHDEYSFYCVDLGYINIEHAKKYNTDAVVLDYKALKAEARKAVKATAKIKAIFEKARADADTVRDGFQSNIKYYLPYVCTTGLHDDYHLF